MTGSFVRLLVTGTAVAIAGAIAFGQAAFSEDRSGAYDAGVAVSGAAARGAGSTAGTDTRDATEGAVTAQDFVIASSHLANSIGACAKIANGQLRLADASGCLPSEVAVTLGAGDVTPVEYSRVLTIGPADANQYVGIFGGLLCPANRTLVSSGFQVLRTDVEIRESFVGPGFGLPRVGIVSAWTDDFTLLPAGDVVKLWVTCL